MPETVFSVQNKMSKKTDNLTLCLVILCSLIALLFDWRITAGVVIGCIADYCYIKLLVMSIDAQLKENSTKNKLIFMGSLRMGILMIPFLLAVLFPEFFHLIGAFIGCMSYKFALFAEGFRKE